MSELERLDLYTRVSRNRTRLVWALVLFTLTIMTLSGFVIFLLHEVFDLSIDFWLLLLLFWVVCALYVILRYALGGAWMLRGVSTLPAWEIDPGLEDVFMAATLASGMTGHIRLFEIPDEDINSFSLSLPDGTYALFATRGVSSKLTEDEGVAILAHEIAHMQAGDTTIYTLMLRLLGRRSLKRMVRGLPGSRTGPLGFLANSFAAFILCTVAAVAILKAFNVFGDNPSPQTSQWFILISLFVVFIAFLPGMTGALLKTVLDREREYYADMQAVFFTRDPNAVYNAIKLAAEDVLDVMFMPACFDALLFCPVYDYSSYHPFRTQPSMASRLEQLRGAFPEIDIRTTG